MQAGVLFLPYTAQAKGGKVGLVLRYFPTICILYNNIENLMEKPSLLR